MDIPLGEVSLKGDSLRIDYGGGVASSGESVVGSTTKDLSGDAGSALVFLLKQEQIDHKRIGFIGHRIHCFSGRTWGEWKNNST